ncbi:MAG: hypothetical protein SH856_13790 [Flavobacteriales bacterium]|nr:hypothetical protein [Flavobacteriales bacterium]
MEDNYLTGVDTTDFRLAKTLFREDIQRHLRDKNITRPKFFSWLPDKFFYLPDTKLYQPIFH